MIGKRYDLRDYIKPGQWCWVIQNEDKFYQRRFLALILERPKEGEVWVTYQEDPTKTPINYKTGQVLVSEIVILYSCTGWDYHP